MGGESISEHKHTHTIYKSDRQTDRQTYIHAHIHTDSHVIPGFVVAFEAVDAEVVSTGEREM